MPLIGTACASSRPTAVPEAKPLAGGLVSGLIASACCGGSLVWGLFGLAALYQTLRLWQYVPQFLVAGALLIVSINWVYYRRKARAGGDATTCRNLRFGMLASAGISLVVMFGGFLVLTWLNHAVVNAGRFMKIAKYAQAVIPGVPNSELAWAVVSVVGGVILIAALPFPAGPDGTAASRCTV
jgi:hypothetical protein